MEEQAALSKWKDTKHQSTVPTKDHLLSPSIQNSKSTQPARAESSKSPQNFPTSPNSVKDQVLTVCFKMWVLWAFHMPSGVEISPQQWPHIHSWCPSQPYLSILVFLSLPSQSFFPSYFLKGPTRYISFLLLKFLSLHCILLGRGSVTLTLYIIWTGNFLKI